MARQGDVSATLTQINRFKKPFISIKFLRPATTLCKKRGGKFDEDKFMPNSRMHHDRICVSGAATEIRAGRVHHYTDGSRRKRFEFEGKCDQAVVDQGVAKAGPS